MAVSALELRPRGPLALFDSAIRLCSRSTGVWSLTLPGGALVTAAALHLFEAIAQGRSLLLPCALFTAAWFARGLFQAAACHYLEGQLIGANPPSTFASLSAALRRLPSLSITVGYLATLSLLGPLIGSHVVGYAVAIQGKGHPLGLFGACSRALGPARNAVLGVRALFAVQFLVMFNLHVAANVALFLGRKLLALELTFADRFASIDNGAWLTAVVAVGFTLFEPLRAAIASLLLIDGRVRQEGLDLVAAIEQLPTRARRGSRMAAILALLMGAGLAQEASAQSGPTQLQARLGEAAAECGYSSATLPKQLEAAGELSGREHSSLTRFLEEVEHQAYEGDCDLAVQALERGLPLIVQTRDAQARQAGLEARQKAAQILTRPEFAPQGPKVDPVEEDSSEPDGWWARFKRWLGEAGDEFWAWLKKLLKMKPPEKELPQPSSGGGAAVANVLVVLLVVGVLAVLALVLLRAGRRSAGGQAQLEVGTLEEGPLSADPMSALSRPPEGWASLADELAARGEFKEAVRSLYLALLSRLHRVGAIDYDPARSNWDYFRGFKGKREWVPPFRELTNRFDFTYYGNLGATPEAYRGFRELSRPLLNEPLADPGKEGGRG